MACPCVNRKLNGVRDWTNLHIKHEYECKDCGRVWWVWERDLT